MYEYAKYSKMGTKRLLVLEVQSLPLKISTKNSNIKGVRELFLFLKK